MRTLALLLVSVLTIPAAATAQAVGDQPSGRFSVTAFTGARVPFTTGDVVVYREDGTPLFAAREQRGGNPVLGLDGEVRLTRAVSALVGGMFSRTGTGEFFVDRDPGFNERGDYAVRYLSDTWIAKAGLSVRFSGIDRAKDGRPMPSTDLFGGAAMVRQFDSTHPAVNLGFRGSFPLVGRRLEASVGLEDYFVFWDQSALAPVMLDVLGPIRAGGATAEMFYDTSHLFVLRLGATLRM